MIHPLACDAPPAVRQAIASLGRTEDVAFSPESKRLAIAGFGLQCISIFDVVIDVRAETPSVSLTGGIQLSSSALNNPHGVDFLDERHVIVANRGGDVVVLEVPEGTADVPLRSLRARTHLSRGGASALNAPGSIVAHAVEPDVYEILVCNNDGHTVTRQVVDLGNGGRVQQSRVLLQKYLDLPDGVTLSPDRRWIAVSNHNAHRVLIYEHSPALDGAVEPVGILRRVSYPHGLSFDPESRYLFVADAGAPFIHVFAADGDGWSGVRSPLASLRMMTDSVFNGAHHSRQEGGPKGLDIDGASSVLVVTSQCQPLAFFDLRHVIGRAHSEKSAVEQRVLDVEHELSVMADSQRMMETIRYMRNSRSWRLTAFLRRVESTLRRHA